MPIIRILLVSTALLCLPPLGHAQENTSTVVLAPIASLSDSSTKSLGKTEALVEAGLRKVANTRVISAKESEKRSRKAKQPELRTCAGNVICLSKLGTLVGARYTVYAELSDLGQTQVIYLKLIDVNTTKEIRSTTLQLKTVGASTSNTDQQLASHAAATRLLAPKQHVGTLAVTSSIAGATVFLDGHAIGQTPSKPVAIYVGSHALRVTHPEARDYVRFVDINFNKATTIAAELKSLPGVSKELTRTGSINPLVNTTIVTKNKPTPWYLRWYTITGGVAAIAITSAILFRADGINPDRTIIIGN